jgi:ETC complex I subunit-like protein
MQLQDALAARAKAAPLVGVADPVDRPDPPSDYWSCLPEDACAIIYCPGPSVMTAGRRGAAEWVLEFEPRTRPFIEPLMGWTGGSDPLAHVRLRFPTREAAIAYARRQGLSFETREAGHVPRSTASRVS